MMFYEFNNIAGYDSIQWHASFLLPPTGGNFYRFIFPVGRLLPGSLNGVNAFIFPKSLRDIHYSGQLAHLAATISTADMNKVYFLLSHVPDNGDGLEYFDLVMVCGQLMDSHTGGNLIQDWKTEASLEPNDVERLAMGPDCPPPAGQEGRSGAVR